MPDRAIILDIETIPDQKECLDDSGKEFAHPIFHKIACIGYIVLDNELQVENAGCLGLGEDSNEIDTLLEFKQLIGTDDAMVVTWSGRRFDIPVILYRSMKYGIPTLWNFRNEFDKRFNMKGHIDLQDHMTNFGATDRIRLDHASTMIGLPGKMDVKGSDVKRLWARNRRREVGTYCVTDVVQTAVLFLRWSFQRGLVSFEEVNTSLDSIVTLGEDASQHCTKGYLGYETSIWAISDGIRQVVENCNWDSLKVGDPSKR